MLDPLLLKHLSIRPAALLDALLLEHLPLGPRTLLDPLLLRRRLVLLATAAMLPGLLLLLRGLGLLRLGRGLVLVAVMSAAFGLGRGGNRDCRNGGHQNGPVHCFFLETFSSVRLCQKSHDYNMNAAR
ncbi:MAG: hypothetical protein ABIQ67_01630 [Sphingomicrobium sp.]